MTLFKVILRQKEKISLPLPNVKDEINLMFNNTVGSASRDDLSFFIVLYFLSFRREGHSILYSLLKEEMPRLKKFIEKMATVEGYLKKGDYARMKKEMKVENILAHDIIFLVIDVIPKLDLLSIKFKRVLEVDPFLKKEMDLIHNEFAEQVIAFKGMFAQKRIRDYRYDPNWDEVHDLSKSVYKTIGMRLVRKIDASLQKKAELEELSHHSPLVVEILQNIDVGLIFDLWESFHLNEYIIGLYAKNETQLQTFIAEWVDPKSIINNLLSDCLGLTGAYLWGNRQGRQIARDRLDQEKRKVEESGKLDAPQEVLEDSYLASSERLVNRIEQLSREILLLEQKKEFTTDEKDVLRAKKELRKKLRNIEVTVQKIDLKVEEFLDSE